MNEKAVNCNNVGFFPVKKLWSLEALVDTDLENTNNQLTETRGTKAGKFSIQSLS